MLLGPLVWAALRLYGVTVGSWFMCDNSFWDVYIGFIGERKSTSWLGHSSSKGQLCSLLL